MWIRPESLCTESQFISEEKLDLILKCLRMVGLTEPKVTSVDPSTAWNLLIQERQIGLYRYIDVISPRSCAFNGTHRENSGFVDLRRRWRPSCPVIIPVVRSRFYRLENTNLDTLWETSSLHMTTHRLSDCLNGFCSTAIFILSLGLNTILYTNFAY